MAAAQKKTIQEHTEDMSALVLYRMDEMQKSIDRLEVKFDNNSFASQNEVTKIEARVEKLEKVTRNSPTVEKVVFTLIGIVLLAVFSALIYVVIQRPQ